ncbi:MAG: dihydroorotase [Candidatus Bipolaricaulota bacterium]|nr:dihydroorotase [Candidatus Bipolaricaulota bacterium]
MRLLRRAEQGVIKGVLVTDVRLVDERSDFRGDLYIEDGLIRAVGEGLRIPGSAVLPGEGRTLLPAFVDLHAHFRDPGYPEKEDIRSGSAAAVHGGYTAVSVMANTDPVCDCPEVALYMCSEAEKAGLVDLYPIGAITRGLAGDELSDMERLAPHVWAFSDDGSGVQHTDVIFRAFQRAVALGRPIAEHSEYLGVNDPALAEELMVNRDTFLSRRIGAALHVEHVSSAGSIELIAAAKRAGARVTCEVTPHHLCLEPGYTVNPPLVAEKTRDRLVTALASGEIDAVGTDHAPHTAGDKEKGARGISGIETAFSLLYTQLVRLGRLDLQTLVRAMAAQPARIIGLNKGSLEVGCGGDVVLIEEDEEFTVTEDWLLSRGKNSPLIGERLWGKVWATVRRGEVVHLDGKVRGTDFDDYRSVV